MIEMVVVLTIIGFVIASIVVGTDMIQAATIRAQISQIEKYKTAVVQFQNKYGYMPGDIPAATAAKYALAARAGTPGNGDGDGIVADTNNMAEGIFGSLAVTSGEEHFFWTDLSAAGLISGNFNDASATPTAMTWSAITTEVPAAAIGRHAVVTIAAVGLGASPAFSRMTNYYCVWPITEINVGAMSWNGTQINAFTPAEAYAIDAKIDDGWPRSGDVGAESNEGGVISTPAFPLAPADGVCISNAAGNPYNLNYTWGATPSCDLLFKF